MRIGVCLVGLLAGCDAEEVPGEAESDEVGTPAVARRPRTPITVDGVLSESGWSLSDRAGKPILGASDDTVTFGALWDPSFLYVGIRVLDGDLQKDSPNRWDDDGVEVYVDARNDRTAAYGADDRQFTKRWSDGEVYEIAGQTGGVLHGWAEVGGGYTVELAVPWSNLGITPAADVTVLGFDIGNNDDDDDGARDGQLLWRGTADNFRDTTAFGDLALSSQTVGTTPDSVWTPLSVMSVQNPMSHGAAGNGTADDRAALERAIAALPAAGGIVYLPAGKVFRKTGVLRFSKAHVKFWAPNRQAEIFGDVSGGSGRQAMFCAGAPWPGYFGVKFRSNAGARLTTANDMVLTFDGCAHIEIVGNEIQGSAASGVFFWHASSNSYVEGNYVHHTWADHIHHTSGSHHSWVWDNWIFNAAPSKGDDGIACVTYGPTSTRCADMEWWRNTHLGAAWGRGYSVIGGDRIDIHHNWAIGTSGAGVIIASEPSYDTAGSRDITVSDNWLYRCASRAGHPGMLVSGNNAAAGPLTNLRFSNNAVVETINGQAFRAEGSYQNVSNTGMTTSFASLPSPIPTTASVAIKDTSILKTRDVSFAAAGARPGLHRIHVRQAPGGGFQQRFEYVVTGSPDDVRAFVSGRVAAGDYLSEQRQVGASSYALLLARTPLTIPSTLSGVSFSALRAGDRNGSLSWLWNRLDRGTY
jgi:hypothetical protein